MAIEKKGVRLEHLSKIYQDQKTGKDFYAVQDANISIAPGEFVTSFWLRKDYHSAYDCWF